jgi:ferredoxin
VTRAQHAAFARAGAALAAAVVVIGVAILVVDYASARSRAPRDEARVAELQAQARIEVSGARALQAELDRLTGARLARRARTDALAIVLIAAAAVFLGCAKWTVAQGAWRPTAPPGPAHKTIRLRKLKDALICYRVTDACIGCTLCAQVCRTGAIAYRPYEKHEIDEARCTWCDKCFQVCRDAAIEVVSTATGAPAPRPDRPRPLAS